MSTRKPWLIVSTAVALLGTAWAQDQGRQFHWSGKMSADQVLTIKNVNGDIDAEAADGSEVTVDAQKNGPDADQVRIEVVPSAEGVTICAIFPGDSGSCGSRGGQHHVGQNDAKVHFTAKVPKDVRLDAYNVNGNVSAEGMGRAIRANSVNGNVRVSTAAWAQAETVNGHIKASMGDAAWSGTLNIQSVNGSIELDMPSDFSAEVRFTSVNGSIHSDFPLDITNSWPVGHNASGKIGSGGRELAIKTVNGSVEIRKGSGGI